MTDNAHRDPILSVIVPFHNRHAMLDELLASMPDRDGLEIILVDDASDAPYAPGRLFDRAVVRVLPNDSGQRYAGSARNVGVSAACGRWLQFVDSDDMVFGDALAHAIDMIAAREDADVLYFYGVSFYEDGSPAGRHDRYNWLLRRWRETGDRDPLILFHPPWGKFIRRDFVGRNALRFDATRVSNDVMFNARLCAAGPRIDVLDLVIHRIREGNPSLTSDPSLDAIRMRLTVMREYNALLATRGLGRLQVPASCHLKRILRRHPGAALLEAVKTMRSRQPLLFTRHTIEKRLRRALTKRIERLRDRQRSTARVSPAA